MLTTAAQMALTTLIRLTPVAAAAAISLAGWNAAGGFPPNLRPISGLVTAIAATGTICFAIRHNRTRCPADLLEALLATRPEPAPALRSVDGQRSAS